MQFIITEYGFPSPETIERSLQFNCLPPPEFKIGDIVIVPPGVYATVNFVIPDLPNNWNYSVSTEAEPDKFSYFPESKLVLSKFNQ
jgi:hypothetical protein